MSKLALLVLLCYLLVLFLFFVTLLGIIFLRLLGIPLFMFVAYGHHFMLFSLYAVLVFL